MSGFLFDTNVLLDIATADPVWLPWSEKQFRSAAAQGPIVQRENTSVESTKPGRAMNADYDLKDPFQSLALKLRLRPTLAEVLARTSAKP